MNLANTNQLTSTLPALGEPEMLAGSPNNQDLDAAKGMIFGIILGVLCWGLIIGVLFILLH